MKKNIALTLAGSDPSGGAGIQADLKAFNMLGVHGLTVVTCITAQNTLHVEKIHKLPVEIIEKQIDTLLIDMKPDAAKTGMLFDEEIVDLVAEKIKHYNLKTVVDPVMVATSGDSLSKNDFVKALKNKLMPKSYMVTPNIHEAKVLTGRKIGDINDVKKACKEIHELGPRYVLIKGGHLEGKKADDVFFDGKEFTVFSLPMIPDRLVHGSGCTISALITGFIAKGEKPADSIGKSKQILWSMINEGHKPGKGADVLNFSSDIIKDMPSYFLTDEHFMVWFELKKAVDELLTFLSGDFVPEVGINFGYSLQNANDIEDVCALTGRITKTRDKPVRCGGIGFGTSKHVASIILTVMGFDPEMRSCMNLRYSEKNLSKCRKSGLKIGMFDRSEEPRGVKSTMEWGTKHVIQKLGFVPDVIYDEGCIGKEPMIRVLGKNPKDVLHKVFLFVK
ncbi:MAG: bifunctional hydroxymethylpyrimidine kinase/phosphomethylpyrimidine kinase [Candidatus Thermoplasmatota archaeon]|jgi:hydroxymethylpyrimidine/phosphomethylpyrimidine kinase|nr:bifunctional hydroxymethylpyrimidine kinase/phosphomethylpyrimidine kinase [Candidatus Thermoplasmatota archaeon]